MKSIISKKDVFTIPNVITLLRLLLIPVFIWLYLGKEAYVPAFLVNLATGLLDILDGKIARNYNMVSDFGKAIDPIVDKLTQAAIFFCLIRNFPNMRVLLIVLIVKEIILGIVVLLAINKTNTVDSAKWIGKLTAVSISITAAIHILWSELPEKISNILIAFCLGMMLLSSAYYGVRNIKKICAKQNK